ncbi:MAG: hypothetical protein NWQ79_01370 [Ilumatobacteraceae bacterium]|nr:hypothetical protein [Ilumatobacteraceae bacterium]
MTWSTEDAGPRRLQWVDGARLAIAAGETLQVTSRSMMVVTMVVVASPDDVFVLCHTGGDSAVSWVERVHPETLETLATSEHLAGGPAWPGGTAVHPNGDIYVVFGNHAHRLNRSLQVVASRELPRIRPYNSFVVLPDGHLVTKDFGGSRPGNEMEEPFAPTQLVVLEPTGLNIVATLDLPEASIARLSANENDVYVVGTSSLWRVRWDGESLHSDGWRAEYRQLQGQTYGWDVVIADTDAWFLDNGESTHKFAGTLRGVGTATAPLHLVRVNLASGRVSLHEICGLAGGVVANPPLVDEQRQMVVGFDSGNGVLAGFSYDETKVRKVWSVEQNHGSHMLLYPESGEFVSAHYDQERGVEQVVVRDISTGREIARADTGSPIQSVVFPACGTRRDFYWCSMLSLNRVTVV